MIVKLLYSAFVYHYKAPLEYYKAKPMDINIRHTSDENLALIRATRVLIKHFQKEDIGKFQVTVIENPCICKE